MKADYNRKRYRDDDRRYGGSKRHSDHESRKNSDHESRPVISNNIPDLYFFVKVLLRTLSTNPLGISLSSSRVSA